MQLENFYPEVVREIIQVCGHECEKPHFHKAVKILDKRLDLGLSTNSEKVFGLMLEHLSFAERFRGNTFIAPLRGENSAVHSLHSAVLTTECFRRAGLLSDSAKELDEKGITQFRRLAAIGALIHDMGEILGEINSVSSAALQGVVKDDTPFEQRVFTAVLSLAFHAVETGNTTQFNALIRRCQKDAGINGSGGKVTERILSAVADLEAETVKINSSLSSAAKQEISLLVGLYEDVELPQKCAIKSRKFLGYLVKACEHVQGSRHLVRFSRKLFDPPAEKFFSPHSTPFQNAAQAGQQLLFSDEMALPIELAHSQEIVSSLKYTEGEVGHLFDNAVLDVERRLATSARNMVYLSIAERLHIYGTRNIDRTHFHMKRGADKRWTKANGEQLESEESYLLDALQLITQNTENSVWQKNEAFEEAEELLFRHVAQLKKKAEAQPSDWDKAHDRLWPIESCTRLRDLYLEAVQVDYQASSGELLFNLPNIPIVLQGFATPRPLAERFFMPTIAPGTKQSPESDAEILF